MDCVTRFFVHIPVAGLILGCLGLLLPYFIFPSGGLALTDFELTAPTSCPVCFQCAFAPITSTPSDLILTFAAANPGGLRNLLLSIRSIGIRSRVVVVVPNTTAIPPDIGAIMNSCGIEIFRSNPTFSKFQAYQEFFDGHGSEFNRVLQVDPANTYFQGDPFTDSIAADGIDFVLEGRAIGESPGDSAVMAACYGESALEELGRYEIAMAGIFGGQSDRFELFVRTIANLTAGKCAVDGADQAHLNYLVWSEKWSEWKMVFGFHGCTSGIVAAPYCLRSTLDSYRVFVGVTGKEASIVHEYGEISTIVRYVQQVCSVTVLSA
jgi:hypothetical protein